MSPTDSVIRNISDTARWSAVHRARETERPDALFRDPLAARLAGERGEQIAGALAFSDRNTWSWIARTVLYDRLIAEQVAEGTDMVINLAAGLDARPYRMDLPPSLQWIEIDLPEILAYKEEILRDEKPVCALERIALDLSDVSARRAVFEQLGRRPKTALIVCEGFLIYLTPEQVGSLADDLAGQDTFKNWVVDLASPGLLRLMNKKMGDTLAEGSSSFKFAPPEGPGFFTPHGWQPIGVYSLLKTAAGLKRLTLAMRLLSLLPESKGPQGSRPWGGVCLLGRTRDAIHREKLD